MSAVAGWERTKSLFQAALDLAPEARAAFVAREAGDDAALREQVLRMLAQDEAPHGMLDGGVRAAPLPAPVALPERIGPYRIERLLGRGGMGVVLLGAREDGGFRQQVAIKLIRGGLFDAALVARFRRERDILARLAHPHIARLSDGGVTPDGLPWYAMDYIEGTPLAAWCDARGATLRERATLFLQVLDAVDYAHRNLVVHRDLKPSNILVTGERPGDAKLLDFGIAKLIDDAEGTALTGSDARLLTPDYAAPEQVLGQPVSTATDVYALGVVLFELLTGRLPYRRSGSGARVAAAIVDDAPSRLRQALSRPAGTAGDEADPVDVLARRRGVTAARLRDALDRDLEQIVAIALAKRPEDRYPSAAAMADDLRAWLDARPLRSRPVPWTRRAAMFVRRHRLGVAAAAAIALVAGAGIAATVVQSVRAQREAATAQAVRRTLTDLFAAADPERNGGDEPTLREVLDLGVERIARDPALGPEVRLPLLSDLGAVYASLGQYERAGEVFGQARATAGEAVSVERARLELRAAEALTELERSDDAARALEAAQAALPGARRDDALGTEIEIAAAWLDERRDRMPAAASRLEALVRRLDAAQPPRPLEGAQALQALGSVELSRGRRDEGLALLRRSLELKRAAGVGALELSSAKAELARALTDTSHAAEAETLMREALATQTAILGKDHPLALLTLGELANTLHIAIKPGEARAAFEAALAGTRRRFGAAHPHVATVANNFGVFLYGERDFAGAATQFETAHAIWRATLGADHERTLQSAGNLAGAWTELGRLQDARPALESLVAARRERGEWSPLSSALLTRGLLLERLGEAEKGRADFAEALELGRANDADNQAQWVWAQVLLARAERRAGRLAEARTLLENAVDHYAAPQYQGGGPRVSTALLELARTRQGQGEARERAVELLRRSLDIRIRRLGDDHPDTAEVRSELERLGASDTETP